LKRHALQAHHSVPTTANGGQKILLANPHSTLAFVKKHAQTMLSKRVRQQYQFADTPSTFPAFIALTSDLQATLQADTQRQPLLKTFDRPVRIIFGTGDPYLNPGVAQHFHEAFPTSELFLLHKGHWPQLDGPEEVARLLLSVPVTTKSSG